MGKKVTLAMWARFQRLMPPPRRRQMRAGATEGCRARLCDFQSSFFGVRRYWFGFVVAAGSGRFFV